MNAAATPDPTPPHRPAGEAADAGAAALEAKLADKRAGEPSKRVFDDDDFGVRVTGPYFRADRRRDTVRRSYTISYTDRPHSPRRQDRVQEQRHNQGKATGRAREVVANFRNGATANAAPRRHDPMDVLLADHLDPANHPKGHCDGRLTGWSSPRTRDNYVSLARWVSPLIGGLPGWALGTRLEGRGDALDGKLPFEAVLYVMDVAGLATSTRHTYYQCLSGLASYGQQTGYIPPDVNPLAGVVKPVAPKARTGLPARWVPPEAIPTREGIEALSSAYRQWHHHRRRWHPEYCWRWAQMPVVVAHSGLRFGEMLGLRACDVVLDPTNPHIKVLWQIDRDGTRVPPKHGSTRDARYPVWLLPVLEQLVDVAVRGNGADALLWPALLDSNKPVGHDSFTTSYFHPQARLAHQLLAQQGRTGWEYADVPQFHGPGAPKVTKTGRQVVQREFRHTINSLRHYYATIALAPRDQGGWGASVHSLAEWMGHTSPLTPWEMYASHLDTATAHHLEATQTDPWAATRQITSADVDGEHSSAA